MSVIGAGPAGSLTAYHLARAGCRVAVLDARVFPRDKACGGGVQERALPRIPFCWDCVERSKIRSAEFSYGLGERFTRRNDEPIVRCVLRKEFDEFLLMKARDAGARILQGIRVHGLSPKAEGVTVHTSQGDYLSRYVVGADGANSVISRTLNKRDDFYWQVALYAEVGSGRLSRLSGLNESIRIDWGALPSGYAWIFPKGDTINVGAGCAKIHARWLRNYIRQFLAKEFPRSEQVIGDLAISGHQLPTATRRTCVARDAVFLVGDAAGLVEPLTGEGISYACHSASLAADSIVEHFGCPSAADEYVRRIRNHVLNEIFAARRIVSLAVSFPKTFYQMFQSREEVWNMFCQVLRGEASLLDLRQSILGPLRVLDFPIQLLGSVLEGRRLSAEKVKFAGLVPDASL